MKKISLILICILTLLFCLPAQAQGAYQPGDTIADFTVTTPQGEKISLSGLLESHKAVLINFWFINCGWCEYEFPYLQQAYEALGEDVAVLALTPYDANADIAAYQQKMGLTFPMAQDSANLSALFGCTGYPTTVMIDRYGVYCFRQSGAFPAANAFTRLMKPFAAADYSTSLILHEIPAAQPSATMPAPEMMAAALGENGFTYAAVENTWPWLLSEDGFAYASNSGEDGTTAALQANFSVKAGNVLAFDYRITSYENDDYLTLYLDGTPVKVFSGEKGWQSYALSFSEDGAHSAVFAYMKSNMYSAANEIACIDNVRILSGDAAQAALSLNPAWPQTLSGTDIAFEPLSAGSRRVVIDDPSGTLDAYYPGAVHYITPGDALSLRIRIGNLIDPETAIAYFMTDGDYQTLSTLEIDEEGYLVSLPVDSIKTSGYAWSALLVYPYFNDYETKLAMFFYASEEDLDHFCAYNISQNVSATWQYADDKAAYTLRFVDQNGAPIAGVIANICDETTCSPMFSDESGVIFFENTPYPYDIHVIRAPAGYAFDASQSFTAPANGGEMTIILPKN